ncbi:MAG: hypothetical protein ABFD69_14855 [Candidatus Sumerlaeia bacterium]
MEINKALDQIETIHEHLARAEMCRDWRSGPVACGGALALAAAAAQARIIGEPAATRAFVYYWVGVAAVAMAVGGAGMLKSYLGQPSPLARRRTRVLAGQFAPSIAVGAIVTAALFGRDELIPLLPGLWALVFGLGTFAARPYLPRIIGWVALYYLIAGGILLALAGKGLALNPWAMGLAFGPGQLLSGLVLYWNLERNGGRVEP